MKSAVPLGLHFFYIIMNPTTWYIIDFDSTFTQVEAMEELAAISLKNDPEKEQIIAEIRQLTDLAMEGKMPFSASLKARIALLSAKKYHINMLVNRLRKKVSPSFARNKSFFKAYKGRVLIVSGGFREFIEPVVKAFHIEPECIFANTFTYDKKNTIIGCDSSNPLSQEGGKVKLLKKLKLKGDVQVIGDGFTDYQIREAGLASRFYAYTENIFRSSVTEKADHIAPSLDEILFHARLPMALSYPKSRIQIVLAGAETHASASYFLQEGYTVHRCDSLKKLPEIAAHLPAVLVVSPHQKQTIPKRNWLAIGFWGEYPFEHAFSDEALRGTGVFHAPTAHVRSATELILRHLLVMCRDAHTSHELRDKTLGIIGYGNCGSALSVMAQALGMEVWFYDVFDKTPMGNAHMARDIQELLRRSDYVVNTSSRSPHGKVILDEKVLRSIRPDAALIHMSLDDTIHLPTVKEMLEQGKLRCFAMDCQTEETCKQVRRFTHTYASLHERAQTQETQARIAQMISEKLIQYINFGHTQLSLNLPNIQLPELNGQHRFIHLHENIPGIMAQINHVLAKHKLNISGQYLQTNAQTGYVITDVEKAYSKHVVDALKAIPGTIRFRVLY